MTRKDYELVAKLIRSYSYSDPQAQISFAYYIADALKKDNPRFNRARFIEACLVNDNEGRA